MRRSGPRRRCSARSCRITTNPRAYKMPSALDEAFAFCDDLLGQPDCHVVEPGEPHCEIFRRLCIETDRCGARVADAWFAALAIESGCEWITFDRFRALSWIDVARADGRVASKPASKFPATHATERAPRRPRPPAFREPRAAIGAVSDEDGWADLGAVGTHMPSSCPISIRATTALRASPSWSRPPALPRWSAAATRASAPWCGSRAAPPASWAGWHGGRSCGEGRGRRAIGERIAPTRRIGEAAEIRCGVRPSLWQPPCRDLRPECRSSSARICTRTSPIRALCQQLHLLATRSLRRWRRGHAPEVPDRVAAEKFWNEEPLTKTMGISGKRGSRGGCLGID
jgi:predicted nucleic acid-binding protein